MLSCFNIIFLKCLHFLFVTLSIFSIIKKNLWNTASCLLGAGPPNYCGTWRARLSWDEEQLSHGKSQTSLRANWRWWGKEERCCNTPLHYWNSSERLGFQRHFDTGCHTENTKRSTVPLSWICSCCGVILFIFLLSLCCYKDSTGLQEE